MFTISMDAAIGWGARMNQVTVPTRSTRPLPLAIEDIDAAWLTAALSSRAPGLKVNNFEIVNVRHGFTTVIRLRLDLNDAGRKANVPSTVILKGGFEPHSRARGRSYIIEAVGYRDLKPLGLNSPACYFVDAEPERRQGIIIMEDLTARGVTFCNGLKPLTYAQIHRRLSALAEFHAKTWNSPELRRPGGRWDSVIENGAHLSRTYMDLRGLYKDEGWEMLITRPQGAVASVHFHDREWHRNGLLYLTKLSKELPLCIVHGDCHLGNFYEDADGAPGFFDWMPRREPAFFEVAYCITCDLDPADRRAWEHTLVAHYLHELSRHGVNIDFDETMYYYKLYLHLGYTWFLMNDTEFQTVAFNAVHVNRFSIAMMDHGTKQLLKGAIASVGEEAIRPPEEEALDQFPKWDQ
jgi:hypothetical protein